MIHPRIFRKNFLNLSERIFSSLKCNTTDHDKQPELDEKIFIPENCNNTLRGSEGSWTIVHLISKPFDPTHVAFSCLLKFEGKANQVVQLKFLGTNLREESKFCSRNYFTIRDFSRFDQMPHSSIYNTITPSSMRIHSTNFSDNYSKHGHLMIPGHFCSFATQKSELDSKYLFAHNMNYFSEHDTLELYLRKDFFAQKHILRPAYLKFKFAYRFIYADQVLTREGTINEPIFRGDKIPNTYCDKIFVGCGGASNSNRNCRIQSPGWPGTYLRNLYCKYHVISNPDPGKDVHISLTLNVKNVVDNAGDNSVLTKTSSKITNPKLKSLEDNNLKKYEIESSNRKRCWRFGDRIEIYEGLKESAQNLIIMFCGGVGKGDTENYLLNTPINQITSRTNTLLIVFRTAAQGKFGYPGFEIAIETVEHSASLTGSILPSPYFSSCHFTIDGSRHKSGFFSSLRHWIKARTMCTLKFKGIPGRQRVLLTFKRFLIKSFSPETYVKERKANRRMVKHTKEDNKKNDSNAKFNTKLLCDRYVTIQLMELPEGEELPNNDNHNHSYKLPVENFPSRATTTTFTTNEKKIITLCSGDVYHNRVTRVEEVSREFQIDEGQEGGIEGVETIFDVLSENSLAYVRYFENQTNFEAPNIRFEGIYQFIDVTHPPYGELKSNTMCDYVFYQPEDNETESLSIQNPANELFYGLGRFQAMKCTYEFRAKSKYEVSINLDYLKFNLVDEKPEHEIKPMIDCTTIYNITTQAYQCVNIVWPTRYFLITSVEGREFGCFCENFAFNLGGLNIFRTSPIVLIKFVIEQLNKNDNRYSVGFKFSYKFIKPKFCDPYTIENVDPRNIRGYRGLIMHYTHFTDMYRRYNFTSKGYDNKTVLTTKGMKEWSKHMLGDSITVEPSNFNKQPPMNPIVSCYWILNVPETNRYTYMKILQMNLLDDDCHYEKLLIYSLGSLYPYRTICQKDLKKETTKSARQYVSSSFNNRSVKKSDNKNVHDTFIDVFSEHWWQRDLPTKHQPGSPDNPYFHSAAVNIILTTEEPPVVSTNNNVSREENTGKTASSTSSMSNNNNFTSDLISMNERNSIVVEILYIIPYYNNDPSSLLGLIEKPRFTASFIFITKSPNQGEAYKIKTPVMLTQFIREENQTRQHGDNNALNGRKVSCGFECPGACIDIDFVCDGIPDCPGNYNAKNSPEERHCEKIQNH